MFVLLPPPSLTPRVEGISSRDFRTDCFAFAEDFTCCCLVPESIEVYFYRLADVLPLFFAIIYISLAGASSLARESGSGPMPMTCFYTGSTPLNDCVSN